VLGALNLQGAWWDRTVRGFQTKQDGYVPTVTAVVRATDVEGLSSELGMYAVCSHFKARLRRF
jgi:hypothetical protein